MKTEKNKKSIRLQKFLAEAGVCSRRSAEKLILEKQVKVGDVVAELGMNVIPGEDRVFFEGRELSLDDKHYYLFHKPTGILSTLKDTRGRRTVAEYLERLQVRAFPVGRLDYDVRGLLILTNDGDWAQSILHPRYQVERIYVAIVKNKLTKACLDKLTNGLILDDGFAKANTADIPPATKELSKLFDEDLRGKNLIRLGVTEGRKHFVKNVLRASGHPVMKLARVSFGPYKLGSLAPGEIKEIQIVDN